MGEPHGVTAGRYLAASVAVLTPCFWQRRIQAGDLSSHIYNAWLAQLIEQGKAGGLTLVRQTYNVLFDMLLSGLLTALGPAPAQRIAVAGAVLIFSRQTFLFIPTTLTAETLFNPFLIHISELTIVIRRPDRVRQGVR